MVLFSVPVKILNLSQKIAMDLLFSTPLNDAIEGSDFVNYYPSVNRNLYFDSIEPYIRQAQLNFVNQIIGEDLVSKLLGNDPKPGKVETAFEQIKFAAAYYTIYLAAPHINVTISDAGIMQSAAEGQARTTQWSYKAARWSALINAHKNIDNAINSLNSIIDDPYLLDWSESKEHLISKTKIFSSESIKEYASVNSFRAFLAVSPYLRRAESKLMEIIGEETYDNIFDGDPNFKKLLDKSRWYVATTAMLDAIPNLSIYIEGNNITVMHSVDGIEPGIGIFSQPHVELVDNMLKKLSEESKQHRQDLINFLRVNKDHFTDWAAKFADTKTKMVYYSEDRIGGVML
jgi:hypothetical protein